MFRIELAANEFTANPRGDLSQDCAKLHDLPLLRHAIGAILLALRTGWTGGEA